MPRPYPPEGTAPEWLTEDRWNACDTGLDEPFDHFPIGGDAVLVRAGGDAYLVFIGDEKDRVAELRLGFKPEVLDSEGCV